MIGIDWKTLEQKLKPFLTKNNSINSRKTKKENHLSISAEENLYIFKRILS